MSSLIIDAGHGGSDPGANGFGTKEKDWTLKMSLYQYKRLKELGAKVAITRTTDKTLDSNPRTALIRDKYTYCMSNHFNAFNGKARGVETIYSIFSKNVLAKGLAQTVCETSGLPLRRVFSKRNDRGTDWYYIQRETGKTQSVHCEYGFIDNKQDHAYYANDKNFYGVAEAVVKFWCSVLDVAYKPAKDDNDKESASLYKVQVGAFKSKANAEKLEDRLKKDGYATFIVKE